MMPLSRVAFGLGVGGGRHFFLGGGGNVDVLQGKKQTGRGAGGGSILSMLCVECTWCFIPKGMLPDSMLGL